MSARPIVRSLTVPFPVPLFTAINREDGIKATVARHAWGDSVRFSVMLHDTDADETVPHFAYYVPLSHAVRTAMLWSGVKP